MTIKYELLKKLVVAAGLKKRWPSVTYDLVKKENGLLVSVKK